MLKFLRKSNYCYIGLETRKLQCIYLLFKNLKQEVKKVNTTKKRKRKVQILLFEVTTLGDKSCRCNYKKRRNRVVKQKQTANKVPFNMFRCFEVRKNVRLMLWKPKNTMKRKCYDFSGYKETNKLLLGISKVNCNKIHMADAF